MSPNDTAYKRVSCHSGHKLLCKLCQTIPPPAKGARFTVFRASRPCGTAGWLALLLTQSEDGETNPGPTSFNKPVWICDICYKQIHVRKQISMSCNRIKPWVHLRCAGIRYAQYTDTRTYHLHRESRPTSHTDITPPHLYRPWSKPSTPSTPTPPTPPTTPTPPTPPQPKHGHTSKNPLVLTGLVKPKTQSSHPLTPSPPTPPEPNTYTSHILHQLITSHAPHSTITRHLRWTQCLNQVFHPHFLHSPHLHCRQLRTITLSQQTHI